MKRLRILIACALPACLLVTGCERPAKKIEFEPNRVLVQATKAKVGEIYPVETALAETQAAVNILFGTPLKPTLPEFLEGDQKKLIDADKLRVASGEVSKGSGLYRKNCVSCHGDTGNGRGLNALQADVYPRDFRMGKFKYKSTPRGAKPTKDDLYATIRNGIAGTAMQVVKELSDDDVRALVDYVIFLSVRGEVERNLIIASEETEFESNKHLYKPGSEDFKEQEAALKEIVMGVFDSWIAAESKVKKAGDAGDIPINATVEELIAAANSPQDSPLKASIERGKQLFTGDTATCFKCHGPKGYGDGQTQDYDDWTKDWTANRGISPTDEEALIPLQAMGALPPRKVVPRDFRKGIYRGGGDPHKLYLRISEGIDGTPMPAAPEVLQPADIWSLINYVRSLEQPSKDGIPK
ncbi:MAG: cytochrome c [Pirellulales bacterium]